MISRRAASEFPNDNPELHDGLVWACPEPCGRALPTLRVRSVAGALPRVLGPSWELEPGPSELEPELPSELEPAIEAQRAVATPPLAAFELFVATVARVALNRGAVRAAGAVTALLTCGRLSPESLDFSLLEALVRRNILAPAGGHVSADFAAAANGWRAVLEGTGGDLSGCGNATLDAWAAELLAALTNTPRSEVGELRRELRRSGVAAFGLLAVA